MTRQTNQHLLCDLCGYPPWKGEPVGLFIKNNQPRAEAWGASPTKAAEKTAPTGGRVSWKLTVRTWSLHNFVVCFYIWRINWRIFSISTVMMKSWKEYGILVDCFGMPWCPPHYMSRWKSPWPPPKRPQIATLPRLVKWKMDSSTTSFLYSRVMFNWTLIVDGREGGWNSVIGERNEAVGALE